MDAFAGTKTGYEFVGKVRPEYVNVNKTAFPAPVAFEVISMLPDKFVPANVDPVIPAPITGVGAGEFPRIDDTVATPKIGVVNVGDVENTILEFVDPVVPEATFKKFN